MYEQLALIEKFLPTWLREPENWSAAIEYGEVNQSTIMSAWREFGADRRRHVVLQIIQGVEPEAFDLSEYRYIVRVAKGVLGIRQGVDLTIVPGGKTQARSFGIDITHEAVLAAGSIFLNKNPEAWEYLWPAGKSGEVCLVRVNEIPDGSCYVDGMSVKEETKKWMLKRFGAIYL